MKNIIYILTLTLLSCSTSRNSLQDVKGKYILESKDAYGELVLQEDNQFSFRHAIGLIDSKSNGTWRIVENKIILLSDSDYINNQIFVKELNDKSNSTIELVHPDNTPIANANLSINNSEKQFYETNDYGEIVFPKDLLISEFKIYYLGETYLHKVRKGNSFKIMLYIDDLSKTYFDSEEMSLKRNKVIMNNGLVYIKN